MIIDKINDSFGQVKKEDDFNKNHIENFSTTSRPKATPRTPTNKRTKWVLLGSIAAIVVACFVLILIDPLGLIQAGNGFEYEDQISSIIEINGQTYAMKRNGAFLMLDQKNMLLKQDNLPADRAFSDDEQIFYSNGNKLFTYNAETKEKSVYWEDKSGKDIHMDYINQDIIIFHRGNHDDYTMISRETGVAELLINRDDSAYFTFQDANSNFIVFSYDYWNYEKEPFIDIESLYVLNLETRNLEQVFSGLVFDAYISQDDVIYAMPANIDRGNGERWSSAILSINLETKDQQAIDLSDIGFTKLQSFTYSNGYLFIATDQTKWPDESAQTISPTPDEHVGKLYQLEIESEMLTELADIGFVFEIITSPRYFYYSNLGEKKDNNDVTESSLVLR